jgi:hypothetical protein
MIYDGFSKFTAVLTPLGPNYREWRDIFEEDEELPLRTALPLKGMKNGEPITVYELDTRKLSVGQLEVLTEIICAGLRTNDVRKANEYLRLRGMMYPIPVEDVKLTIFSQETKE